ncbi:hypothetical protein T10_8730 [Trichinella papuae]|uniref:Uncharacterized protein n=1 Tax=Trichinella papuae TaxID=268474 RepID=A0A0V1M1V8_9BILA|nr:hypothetical protein T10_8730 [Trichinella papuae]
MEKRWLELVGGGAFFTRKADEDLAHEEDLKPNPKKEFINIQVDAFSEDSRVNPEFYADMLATLDGTSRTPLTIRQRRFLCNHMRMHYGKSSLCSQTPYSKYRFATTRQHAFASAGQVLNSQKLPAVGDFVETSAA